MDKDVVKNAMGGLEKIISKAKRGLREVEYEAFGGSDDLGSYESPRDAMAFNLQEAFEHLIVVLEAAGMCETRTTLVARWTELKKQKDGLRHTKQFGDFEHLDSPALEVLERIISALRMTISNDMTSEEAWTLSRLETVLKDTAVIMHRRKVEPANELQLQEIMHEYLDLIFPEFRKSVQIGGSIKSFKPDCGIENVKAAIEFKIAHTKEEAVRAFSGIVEDTGGYRGSPLWTRFYAVIYQAKPFLSGSKLESDLQRIGAATWKAFLVNGDTTKKTPRKSRQMKRRGTLIPNSPKSN